MTNEEAIKQIDSLIENSQSFHEENGDIWEQDIEALNIAKQALEKQIPKKPIFREYLTAESPIPNDDWWYECPCCGNEDIDYPEHHCKCGQALDWGETE